MQPRDRVDGASRTRRGVRLVAAIVLAVTVASCGLLEPEITGTGTIVFLDIEGGCWVIDTVDERYAPFNLPLNKEVDGLEVDFEGTPRPDLTGFCPGVIMQLTYIEEVDA